MKAVNDCCLSIPYMAGLALANLTIRSGVELLIDYCTLRALSVTLSAVEQVVGQVVLRQPAANMVLVSHGVAQPLE